MPIVPLRAAPIQRAAVAMGRGVRMSHVYRGVHRSGNTPMYTPIHTHVYARVCLCVGVCADVYVQMYLHMFAYMYSNAQVYEYVYLQSLCAPVFPRVIHV